MKLKKFLLVFAILVCAPAFLFVGCGHEHEFGEALKSNATHHWYECECGEKKDEAEHKFNKQVQTDAYLKTSTDTQNIYYKSCACGAKASANETFTIDKTIPTLENVAMSSVEITYLDNYSVNYSTNSTGTVVIEYKTQGEPNEAYTTQKPTDAGDYTARVTVLSNKTYALVKSDPINFTIAPFKLMNLETSVVYNGTNKHIIDFDEVAPGEFEPNLSLEVTFNDNGAVGATPTGAIPKIDGISTTNYVVDYGTCIVTICPKEVQLDWQSNNNPFIFDGTEKEPSVSLVGVVQGDEVTPEIEKHTGDNIWFDETFNYNVISLSGADQQNYVLPTNTISPTYSIVVKSSGVGDSIDLGLLVVYSTSSYVKISLTTGHYAFKYINSTQDAQFSFEIFKKGETTAMADASFENSGEVAFRIEEDGEYYIKCDLLVNDEPQGDELIIINHVHEELDEYGHCVICGEYQGKTENINSNITVTFDGEEKLYYRFKVDYDKKQKISFTSGEFNYTAYGVRFSGTDYDADIDKYNVVEEIELTDSLKEFEGYDYYYLVITQKGTTTSVVFQLEEASF